MCGRFTLRTPAAQLAIWFRDIDFPVVAPRFNIAPTQQILALRDNKAKHREAVLLRWGLIPSWAKDTKIGNQMINARSETAAEKPAFRRAFKSRRCVILADGFYEWKPMSGGKQPFLIQPAESERPLFCFAGLWESWKPPAAIVSKTEPVSPGKRQRGLFDANPDSLSSDTTEETEWIESCTILTTSANEFMSDLHDRMPVILDFGSLERWLSRDVQDPAELAPLMNPCPNDWLRIQAVSKLVNKPAVDNPACAEPVELTPED